MSYSKDDCRHLNSDAKTLNEKRMTMTETTRHQFLSEYYRFRQKRDYLYRNPVKAITVCGTV